MDPENSTKAPSANGSPEKKGDKHALIDLKNGKVVCKQKCVSFEKQSETLQEIVKFREMIEEMLEKDASPLKEIPEEHRPLIAKLAHESDKGLGPLAKHIRQELLPAQDEEDAEKAAKANAILPQSAVEAAITSTLNRNNYGLDLPQGVKPLAALAVWRWEVKEAHWDWLPKSGREKAEQRLEERKSAHKALNLKFEELPQSEKDTILRTKGKLQTRDPSVAETSTPEPTGKNEVVQVESAKKQGKRKADEATNDENGNTPKASSKQPKPVDPEKAAKEKERLEKKAAKAEKEKKIQDAQNKSRSIMANFFSKPKVTASSRPKEQSKSVAGPSKVQSDFEKTFKPFVKKKDSVIAPTNWFKESAKRKRVRTSTEQDVIVIEDEDVAMSEPQLSEDALSQLSAKDRLTNSLSMMPPAADPSRLTRRRKLPAGYKTYYPLSVRDIMNQLSEAEVAGDDQVVRNLLAKLQNRTLFPPKVFIFHEDARPGYYGTWTRSSRIIGPRRPLAKDLLVFDYGYDSGEEWEEEPVGEDVADDDDDEDDGDDGADSDADSWLVDDDEEPEILSLGDLDSITPPDLFDSGFPPPLPKRKADDGEKKGAKKRKVVVPLVPFMKGPCWEEKIGECSYDPFKAYQIRLFNDTPYPIDPFTYVSTCNEDYKAHLKAQQAAANAPAQDGFAVPPVPLRLGGATSSSTPTHHLSSNASTLAPSVSTPTTTSSALASTAPSPSSLPAPLPPTTTTTATTKKAPALRTPFPDAHVPFVISKIAELDTSSFVLLVETIYEALKPHKVTKAAVEAKIREVGEKDKTRKKWAVKGAFSNGAIGAARTAAA